jgi:hypothetical protein
MESCRFCAAIEALPITDKDKCKFCVLVTIDNDLIAVSKNHGPYEYEVYEVVNEAVELLRNSGIVGYMVEATEVGHWGLKLVTSLASMRSKTRSE